MSVYIPGGYYTLAGLLCDSIAYIELAFLDSIFEEVDHGVVACFTLVCPVEPPYVIGVYGALVGGKPRDA